MRHLLHDIRTVSAVLIALMVSPAWAQVAPEAEAPVAAPSSTQGQAAPVPALLGGTQFSYGNSDLSLFLLPIQMQQLQEALRTYESSDHTEKPPTFESVEAVPTVETITEPPKYPVFFLSSIVYRAPNDWSVWVSGHKITSRKNETDVQVISVTRETASFSWQPSYTRAIAMRQETKNFAPTDNVKNKLAATQLMRQDPKTGAIYFTLRQNQAFAVGYFKIFEGYIETPTLTALTPADAATGTTTDAFVAPNLLLNQPAPPASLPRN